MFKRIKSYFTLKETELAGFTDMVSGKQVRKYRDCYGDLWMKESRWALFAVKCER